MIEIFTSSIVMNILIVIIVASLVRKDIAYRQQDDDEEQEESTFRYCEMVVDPEMPMKHRGGTADDESNSVDFIPMEYRGVLEQDETGTYRYVPLNGVMNEAMDNEDTQETTESITD